MAAASSIGEAIALQRRDSGDYWLRRLAEDMRLAKAAEEKKKEKEEEELASLMDFKIDYSKYLPAYAKKITSEYASMINNIAKLRQDDPNVSHYALKREVLNAKDKMNSYVIGNQMAMDYLKNDKIKKDNDFSFALTSGDSTLESLSQMSNPGFYVISPTGSFNYRNVPNEAYDAKWGNPNIEKPTGNTQMVAGTKFIEFQEDFDPITVSAVKQRGKDDPVLRMQMLFDLSRTNPEYKQKIEQGENDVAYAQRMAEPLDLAIDAYLEKQKPGGKIKYERGYQTEDGGGKKLYDAEMTTNETLFAPVVGGGGKKANVPIAAKPVKVTNAINLTSNGQFRLVDNFSETIPKEYDRKTLSFNFRPNKIVSINVNGVKKLYAQGSILAPDSEEATDFISILNKGLPPDQQIKVTEKTKWATAQNILVPYSGSVKSLIKAENNTQSIEDYDIVGETEKIFKSQKGGGSYSSAQEQGIKNVMEDNGISRDEAISALKAKKKL